MKAGCLRASLSAGEMGTPVSDTFDRLLGLRLMLPMDTYWSCGVALLYFRASYCMRVARNCAARSLVSWSTLLDWLPLICLHKIAEKVRQAPAGYQELHRQHKRNMLKCADVLPCELECCI